MDINPFHAIHNAVQSEVKKVEGDVEEHIKQAVTNAQYALLKEAASLAISRMMTLKPENEEICQEALKILG